jgi:hypothetical protein
LKIKTKLREIGVAEKQKECVLKKLEYWNGGTFVEEFYNENGDLIDIKQTDWLNNLVEDVVK